MLEGIPPFLDQDMFKTLPRNKIVVICTGSQGEPRAAIARIARGEHPAIDLNAGDRMIFSSWAIPGNEREVIDIQNMLIDRGIEVITQKEGLVHTTGHPRREELKRLYDMLQPVTLVPVHGEAAHLEAHAALGRQHGIKNVVHARNGDMVRLFPEVTHFPGEVRTGELYLDGNILCTPDESGVKGPPPAELWRPYRRQRLRRQSRHCRVRGRTLLSRACRKWRTKRIRSRRWFATWSMARSNRSRPSVAPIPIWSIPPCSAPSAARVNAWWGKKPNVTVFVHRV